MHPHQPRLAVAKARVRFAQARAAGANRLSPRCPSARDRLRPIREFRTRGAHGGCRESERSRPCAPPRSAACAAASSWPSPGYRSPSNGFRRSAAASSVPRETKLPSAWASTAPADSRTSASTPRTLRRCQVTRPRTSIGRFERNRPAKAHVHARPSRRDARQSRRRAPSLRRAAPSRCRRARCRASLDNSAVERHRSEHAVAVAIEMQVHARPGCSGPHAKQLPSSNGTSAIVYRPASRRSARYAGSSAWRILRCTSAYRIVVAHPLDRAPSPDRNARTTRCGIEIARLPDAADVDDVAHALFEISSPPCCMCLCPIVPSASRTQYSAMCVCPMKTSGASVAANARAPPLCRGCTRSSSPARRARAETPGTAVRRQRVEPRAAFRVEHALRPRDRGARRVVEIRDAEVVDRREVVVAEHRGGTRSRNLRRRTRSDSGRSPRCRPGTAARRRRDQRERGVERLRCSSGCPRRSRNGACQPTLRAARRAARCEGRAHRRRAGADADEPVERRQRPACAPTRRVRARAVHHRVGAPARADLEAHEVRVRLDVPQAQLARQGVVLFARRARLARRPSRRTPRRRARRARRSARCG